MVRRDGTGLTAVRIPVLRASRATLVIRGGLNFAFYSIGKVRKIGLVFSLAHLALVPVGTFLLDRWNQRPRTALEYHFQPTLSAWRSPSGWSPQVEADGLTLVHHDNLSKVLVLTELTSFMNGEIECEVCLSPESIFNVVLRGSLTEDEFYIARFDARSGNHYDAILIKERGKYWDFCNRDELKHKSPSNRRLQMRIRAKNRRIELYRDGKLVHWINDAEKRSGVIALFTELPSGSGSVHVKAIRIWPEGSVASKASMA